MVREHGRGTVESCDRYIEQLVDMLEPIIIFRDSCFRPYSLQKGRNQMTTTTRETGRQPTDMVFFFFFSFLLGFLGGEISLFLNKEIGEFFFFECKFSYFSI